MLVLFVLATLCNFALGHTVTLCYDVKSKPGTLIIWQEHWHGDYDKNTFPTVPYGILFSNPTTQIDFSKWYLKPHNWRNNIGLAALQAEKPNLVCNACYGTRYSDWFSYEFPVCIFGAKGLSLTVTGDHRVVVTEPSDYNKCPTRITVPPSGCPDNNGDGFCDICNCVSCSGTPFDSVCGNSAWNKGEECDDGSDTNCKNCKCVNGYTAKTPAAATCELADPCKTLSFNGNNANTQSCTNSGANRVITCAAGYYVKGTTWLTSVTLAPTATFSGCIDMDECAAYGYNGRVANTQSCTTPVLNQRVVTCAVGYVVGGTSQNSITLTGAAVFSGCADADECTLYGNSGQPKFVASCVSGNNARTLTCQAGYEVIGTQQQQSITLIGSAAFTGCQEIDECKVYGFSNNNQFTDSCVDGINKRTITCTAGYYIKTRTMDTRSSDYVGNSAFPGCVLADYCVLYAYSGKPQNTKSCTPGINQRFITCNSGFYAVAPSNPTVTLIGSAAFQGCNDIGECTLFGYSGNGNNAASCVETGTDDRVITCNPGYYVTGKNPTATNLENSIKLTGNAAFPGCSNLDECKIYGYSGKGDNTKDCVDGDNKRTITCAPGYYINGREHSVVSADYVGAAPFNGCATQNQCTLYGFSGKPENTESCVPGTNMRTLTCLPGYYVTAPATRVITLTGSEVFTGCKEINECELYGNNGKAQFIASCVDGTNKRTITCTAGYKVVGKTAADNKIELIGNAEFPGCVEINECQEYSFSGNTAFTKDCVDGINKRVITCQPGYYVKGQTQEVNSQELIGNAQFAGCVLADLCMLYGLNGNAAYTQGCVPGINSRIITCTAGFYAVAPAEATITITGNTPFTGCFPIDECKVYGTNGKGANADSCVDGFNSRTITCKDGFFITGKAETQFSISLTGKAEFPGCTELDECKLYAFSGKADNTQGCKDQVNGREITCKLGYKVGPGHDIFTSLVFTGNAAFPGCFDINECDYYGFTGRANNTVNCENLINSRKITCRAGFYAVEPATASIVLTGNAVFAGCKEIDECKVYGNSGQTTGYVTCKDGVNERTITCADGYYAVAPGGPRITLAGAEKFVGCKDVDECQLYGSSGLDDHVTGCTQPFINARTITCERGYRVSHKNGASLGNITLLSLSPFPGCTPWCGDGIRLTVEECDDSNLLNGDGCNSNCTVEVGYNCGGDSNQGLRCCKDLDETLGTEYGLNQDLECYDHWWVSPDDSPIVFEGDAALVIDNELNLCGQIQLGRGVGDGGSVDVEETPLRDRTPTWIVVSEVHVAGSVEVFGDGALWFKGENSLHIEHACRNLTTAEDQFTVYSTGLVAISEVYWAHAEDDGEDFDDTPDPFIYVEDCSMIDEGAFFINATIPPGSNVFPLINGDCTSSTNQEDVGTFLYLDHYINGHCSNIGTESDQDTVWVRTNHKDLCTGEIAAMGVVVVGLGAAAAGATAVGAGGLAAGGGAADAYVAL